MVFPQDPKWRHEYLTATGNYRNDRSTLSSPRFRSWGTEELLIRCIRKNLPWIRTIYILLARPSQVQPWMEQLKILGCSCTKARCQGAEQNSKIKIVFHRDFIPSQYLPTFNANTIEMWLHKIPDLSEYFIYGNDDLFPISPLQPEDFFRQRVGAPRDNDITTLRHNDKEDCAILPCQHMREKPFPEEPNTFQKFVKNGLDMVAADWGVKFTDTWLRTGHSLQPMLRSTVEHVCTIHADRILQSFTLSRKPKNFNQYIFPFWQHLSGRYIDHMPRRTYIGKDVATSDLANILRDPNIDVACINDNKGITADWEARAEIVRREIAARLCKIKN